MGNTPLNLNWQHLLNNAAPPPEIEVVVGNCDPSLLNLSDQQIQEKIRRLERTVGGLGETLPDKGVKLRSQIYLCQNELERRKLVYAREDAEKSERASQSPTTESSGPVNDIRPWADVKSQQSFTVIFSKKLEERSDSSNGEWRSINREKSENSRKDGKPTRVNRKRIRRTSLPPKMSSKPLPFQSARSLIDKDNDGRVTWPSKSLPSRRCFPDNSFKRGKVSGNNNAVDERSKKMPGAQNGIANGTQNESGPADTVATPPQPTAMEQAINRLFRDLAAYRWNQGHMEDCLENCGHTLITANRQMAKLKRSRKRLSRKLTLLRHQHGQKMAQLELRIENLQARVTQQQTHLEQLTVTEHSATGGHHVRDM